MKKLSGILEFSMDQILCLRGFASFKDLCKISEPSPEVQRNLIEDHKGEMARFLNEGEYRFFPEVILSLDFDDSSWLDFYNALQSGQKWNKKVGNIQCNVKISRNKEKLKIASIEFDEEKHKLTIIDGNHRLSAGDEVKNDFKTPFCLILCETQRQEEFSRVFFHNINAKQIPLNLEENLKVIIEGEIDAFSDEKLKKHPAFGWEYYLTRIVSKKINYSQYPFINNAINGLKYTFWLEEFKLLLQDKKIEKTDSSAKKFMDELPDTLSAIESALQEITKEKLTKNMAVIGAVSYYKIVDEQKYNHFLSWISKNDIIKVPNLHIIDIIRIYNKIYENTPKTIFVSMKFGQETDDTFDAIKETCKKIEETDNICISVNRVDENVGKSEDILQRIKNGIRKSSLVIADLSNNSGNVYHEIGYAQGLEKDILLLYKEENKKASKDEIASNLSMHNQLRFKTMTELKKELLKRIKEIFKYKEG